MTNVSMTVDELQDCVEAIFGEAGLSAVQASAVARVIAAAERDACKSHGIYRIEGALRTIKAGKVRPEAVPQLAQSETPAVVKVDARGGFANPAFEMGLPGRPPVAGLRPPDCGRPARRTPRTRVPGSNAEVRLVGD